MPEPSTIDTSKRIRTRFWLVGLLLLGLAIGWWHWINDRNDTAPAFAVDDSVAKVDGEKGVDRATPVGSTDRGVDAGEELSALEHYKESTRYPPTTRKLTQDSHDLLNPGARHELRQKLPGDRDSPDMQWEVLFTADRYFVRASEPVLITLQLWNKGEIVLPAVVSMVAQPTGAGNSSEPVRLKLQTDGAARTAVFKPEDLWPDYAGQIRVVADFFCRWA